MRAVRQSRASLTLKHLTSLAVVMPGGEKLLIKAFHMMRSTYRCGVAKEENSLPLGFAVTVKQKVSK